MKAGCKREQMLVPRSQNILTALLYFLPHDFLNGRTLLVKKLTAHIENSVALSPQANYTNRAIDVAA
jgi:hypothetical protein